VRFLQDRRTVFALLDRRLWPKSRVPRKEKFPPLVTAKTCLKRIIFLLWNQISLGRFRKND
jgi:hypothetical protein